MPTALSNATALRADMSAGSDLAVTARPDVASPVPESSAGGGDDDDERERFIPITLLALLDRLTVPEAWPQGMAAEARRFFRYLDHWRQQQYGVRLLRFEESYEPFSPDSDLLITRTYTDEERVQLRQRAVEDVEYFLRQANYTRIDPTEVDLILTSDSYYGLDLFVDLGAFDELLIYYRGRSTRRDVRRLLRKFLRKEEFEVPIYRRLFVLFKLKPEKERIEEVMRTRKVPRWQAKRMVRNLRKTLAPGVKDNCIYMKLFKNIPRTDLEMIFPNTRVRFRPLDKIKLWVTGSAGLGFGGFTAAGKIALAASNPIAAAGAVAGFAGICFRQAMNFLNQRQRYMVVMAQNLYFHAMADNHGVAIKLANRAAEEDVKEEILLYSVLATEQVNARDLKAVDERLEKYILDTFGVSVNFDLWDALSRLKEEGIVREDASGNLLTLPPAEAARLIDRKWDAFLDELSDDDRAAGREVADRSAIIS
jgi:hypothetical protein